MTNGRLGGRPFVLCGLPIMDNQQPQPQLLSQPLFPQPPKPQPPQQTRMSTSIRIQVQLFPPKQLLHIEKTSFFLSSSHTMQAPSNVLRANAAI